MFKQLFATMNELLDEIMTQYPLAAESKKKELDKQLAVLKSMSDGCIEDWLLFEEKLSSFLEDKLDKNTVSLPPSFVAGDLGKERSAGSFSKGQGFYKLSMFEEAISEFEGVVRHHPDFLLARMYLAMSYLRTGEYGDAYRHFQFLVPLTDNRKLKAISYNAMGCIHAERNNMDKAREYFKMAHSTDPTCVEPSLNLNMWSKRT